MDIGKVEDLYNKLYLGVLKAFSFLEENELSSIDEKVNGIADDLFLDFKIKLPELNSKILRMIKVRVIKEYFSIPKSVSNGTAASMKMRAVIATGNIYRKIALELIPQTKIIPVKNFSFSKSKIKYLQDLKKGKVSPELQAFLNNPTLKKLAKQIDQNMENKNLTYQKLAKLISIKYKTKIEQVIRGQGMLPGANSYADACLALLLLQKNDQFENAIKLLSEYVRSHPNSGLEFIDSNCKNYQLGIDTIVHGVGDGGVSRI